MIVSVVTTAAAVATHLLVDAVVRYFEDAERMTGTADEVPLRFSERWIASIRLADGVIEGWPAGEAWRIHFKVCDDGEYWLRLSEAVNGFPFLKWKGHYVPEEWLAVTDSGDGDYIILNVGVDGKSRAGVSQSSTRKSGPRRSRRLPRSALTERRYRGTPDRCRTRIHERR